MAHAHSPELLKVLALCTQLCLLAVPLYSSVAVGQEPVAAGLSPPEVVSEPIDEVEPEAHAIYPRQRDGALYFGKGSADLSPDALEVLYHQADRLKTDRRRSIALEAYLEGEHVDSLEIAAANKRLKIVASVLREFGVSAQQITTRVHYESDASAPCATETCRVSYRRVELRVKEPPHKSAKRQ